jgi:uncharacterized protein YcbX
MLEVQIGSILILFLAFSLLIAFVAWKATSLRRIKLRDLYDFGVETYEEIDVPITQLYLTPVRGLQMIRVDSIELSDTGVIKDRTWQIVCAKTKKALFMGNCEELVFLKQEFVLATHNGSQEAEECLRVYLTHKRHEREEILIPLKFKPSKIVNLDKGLKGHLEKPKFS